MDTPFVVAAMVALAERSRTVIAGKRFCTGVQKQVRFKATWIAKWLATDKTDIVTTNKAFTHEHVIEVAVVAQDAFLAVLAGKDCFSWVNIDVNDQRFEGRVDDTTFGARRKQMAFTCHVLV